MEWKRDEDWQKRGIIAQKTFDLAEAGNGLTEFIVSPNMLGYRCASLEIQCVVATGTTGNVIIHETNTPNAQANLNYTTGLTVALGTTVNNMTPIPVVNTAYLALQFPKATLGSTGKIIVRLVAKN